MFRNLTFATCFLATPALAADPRWTSTNEPAEQNGQTFCALWVEDAPLTLNFYATAKYSAISMASSKFQDLADAPAIEFYFSGNNFYTDPAKTVDAGSLTVFVTEAMMDDIMSNFAVAAAYGAPFKVGVDGYVEELPVDTAETPISRFANCRGQLAG